jgi:hypothetical protein
VSVQAAARQLHEATVALGADCGPDCGFNSEQQKDFTVARAKALSMSLAYSCEYDD